MNNELYRNAGVSEVLIDLDKKEEVDREQRKKNIIIYRLNEIDSEDAEDRSCLLYTSPSPRDRQKSRMPSSA